MLSLTTSDAARIGAPAPAGPSMPESFGDIHRFFTGDLTWQYGLACAAVFLIGYLVNTSIITVGYHRGLAHDAVKLSPWARRFVARYGIWLTGLDPKGWVCMHRLHHDHSDTENDPHSPVTYGVFGVLFAQLRNYKKVLTKLAAGQRETSAVVADLDFEVNKLNRLKLWWLPYALHAAVALAIALPTGMWLLGACYWTGIMSHPIEGFIVNSLGHAFGGRNFNTPDNSRNNHWAAWLIMGEGFQNNHHAYPASARFSFKPLEFDLGYRVAQLLEAVGVLKIRRDTLIHAAVLAEPARSSK